VARVEKNRGNLKRALHLIDEALAALESARRTIASPSLRASLLASARDYQELNIEILMALHAMSPNAGFDRAALVAAERGRARAVVHSAGGGVQQRRLAGDAKPAEETPTARGGGVAGADRAFAAEGAKAGAMLLGPAAWLMANKSVLVVAERALQ